MAGFQQTQIIGHVGRDPDLKYTGAGVAVCDFSVAVTKSWTDRTSGEKREKTTWFKCTAWRRTAEMVNDHVVKGMRVFVQGEIEGHAYMSRDEEPEPRCSLEITIRDIQFLSRPNQNGSGERYEREESEYPDWD